MSFNWSPTFFRHQKVTNSKRTAKSRGTCMQLYALATREAEFRFSANSALYMLVFGSFSPKIHLQNPKKKISFSSIFLKTLPNVWQTIRRSAKSYFPKSESLPKGTKKAKKIRKFAERDKKGEKNPKVCRIPILLLNFAEKNLQKICL